MLRQAGLKGALWSTGYPPLKNQLLGSNLAAGWMVGWSLSVWSFYVLTESV